MAADKAIKEILAQIDGAIVKFQQGVPGIQKGVLNEVINQLKDLSVQNGRVLNSVQNLKLVIKIKNQLERLIVSAGYKDSVKDFVRTFESIAQLNIQYFASFNNKYKPSATLPIIKEAAIDKTLNDLLGQGLQSNIVDRVQEILLSNVTTGGSYASLADQLRNLIESGDSGEGIIQRYTKTVTTDAINQFSAQYHDTIAQDLGFNWCRYVGSNITTTREFCEWLTKKEWIHRSEFPKILKGEIDGHQCKLNKQGLPLGMIPGTTVDNFKVRRGGYNCGHQGFWLPDNAVPAHIMAAFEKKPADGTKNELKVADTVIANNRSAVKKIEKKGIKIYSDLLNALPDDKLKIEAMAKKGAYYTPSLDKISIGSNPSREKSQYFKDTLMAHETAHAIHNKKGVITSYKVSDEFRKHFDGLKEIIKGKEKAIEEALINKFKGDPTNTNSTEQIAVMLDILGSLTLGRAGQGHSVKYYRSFNGAEKEIFAHGVSLTKVDNGFSDITGEMAEVVKKMKDYSINILK